MYIVIGKIEGRWYSLNVAPVDEATANFQASVQSYGRRCETRVVRYISGQYPKLPKGGRRDR
jgi:hypothetical protein